MVRGSLSLPTPASVATPFEAVLAVPGTRPDSEMATSSCPSRVAAGRGPTVEWPLIAARVRATSVPACYVAPDHRPSLDLGQSRHMASAFAVAGWLPNAASARPTPRILGPGDRSTLGAPSLPVSSGALARLVHLPARVLSAFVRTLTAGLPVRVWALTACPGGTFLARRLAPGR